MKRRHTTFTKDILPWFKRNARKLPWRKKRISAYEVWISEVMLQQTQVSRVIPFYKKFLKKFPNASSLARASWREFLPYYDGLGYYQRGRNMLQTAKIIEKEYKGRFPKEKKELMSLPGIGEYTASAILSFAYNEPVIAYDTNMKKIFGTRERAEDAFRKSHVSSRIFNSAVMDYGSTQQFVKKKKAQKKDTKTLPLFILLHEDHKKYYSPTSSPRLFPLPRGVKNRNEVKDFFRKQHGLTVAVRPPKMHRVSGKEILVANTQVLLGRPRFQTFTVPAKKDLFKMMQTPPQAG